MTKNLVDLINDYGHFCIQLKITNIPIYESSLPSGNDHILFTSKKVPIDLVQRHNIETIDVMIQSTVKSLGRWISTVIIIINLMDIASSSSPPNAPVATDATSTTATLTPGGATLPPVTPPGGYKQTEKPGWFGLGWWEDFGVTASLVVMAIAFVVGAICIWRKHKRGANNADDSNVNAFPACQECGLQADGRDDEQGTWYCNACWAKLETPALEGVTNQEIQQEQALF